MLAPPVDKRGIVADLDHFGVTYPFQSVGIAGEDHTPRGTSSITAPRPGGRFKRQKADGGMAARKEKEERNGAEEEGGGRSFAPA
ncbi:hypothetical protein EYF80_049880 [Liparis tanakae]|uniref:Uncharacterized protein n=1 Tax=Liparis tanakae TaxID=230148 RepID=A0A4Z2FGR5_9TELE|nr:hypothetical protein EYF80_049880 [Liparis tanakae]